MSFFKKIKSQPLNQDAKAHFRSRILTLEQKTKIAHVWQTEAQKVRLISCRSTHKISVANNHSTSINPTLF